MIAAMISTSSVFLIPLFPLLGFLLLGLLNKKLQKNTAAFLACGSVFVSFVISALIFFTLPKLPVTVKLFEWVAVGSLKVDFSFLVDPLSTLFLLIITGVGFLIHVYSVAYMRADEGHTRFFAYLNLFIFFMLLLVLGNNFLVMFVGWEGVGLCSYLLIGFWFKNAAYNDAAKKAFIMNRIGDFGFLLGIFLIFVTFGSLNFADVFSKVDTASLLVLNLIGILLFIGAVGKSAQFPLYTWLPDAMAGPTPVSALIHAATMVTAGIYMVARANAIFIAAPDALALVKYTGLTTAIFAASIGLFQNDIKKILAYSTVSQLGIMFLALGVGAFTGAVFHVMTHAFFKALLFLGAGSVIHALGGEQDIRNMGGLKKKLPITHFTFLIGTLAIAGFPPFSGFFSKDEILSRVFENSPVLWGVAVLGSLLTCFYMFRLYFLTFHGSFRGTKDQAHHLHESPKTMTFPLMLLAFLSAFGGFLGIPHIFKKLLHIPHALQNFLSPVFGTHETAVSLSTSTEIGLMAIPLLFLGITVFLVYNIFILKNKIPLKDGMRLPILQNLIYNKYYIDECYEILILQPFIFLCKKTSRFIELYFLDGIVNGSGKFLILVGQKIRILQTGNLGFYLFVMVLTTIGMLKLIN